MWSTEGVPYNPLPNNNYEKRLYPGRVHLSSDYLFFWNGNWSIIILYKEDDSQTWNSPSSFSQHVRLLAAKLRAVRIRSVIQGERLQINFYRGIVDDRNRGRKKLSNVYIIQLKTHEQNHSKWVSVIVLNLPSPMPLFSSTPHENHMALDRLRAVSSFSFRASLNRPNGLNRSKRYSITATMWTESKTSSHKFIWKGRRNESRLFRLDSFKNEM